MPVRRKCFISYHHADQTYVDNFVRDFDHHHDIFISRRLGEMPDDIINSYDPDYVMQRIRADYITDSTVTIVLMGANTWGRRYIDWEIQASLRSGNTIVPNGLLGIKLPTFTRFPNRFDINIQQTHGIGSHYAGWIDYPKTLENLAASIEWAYGRRTTHNLYITNPRDKMTVDYS